MAYQRSRYENTGDHPLKKFGIIVFPLAIILTITAIAIGGFVGNDFYGSGYDTDFYKIAIDELSNSYLEHIESIQLIIETLKRGTIKC